MPDPFANLPPISFVVTDTTAIASAVVKAFQDMWFADTGEILILTQADRRYHFLLCLCAYLLNERALIDESAKQNLLPYASGGFLDNLATLYGPRMLRLQASAAQVPLQFTLGALLNTDALIPAGTLVSAQGNSGLIFATNEDLTIPIGAATGTVNATCQTVGPIGNGLLPGTLTNLMNWSAPFTVSVTNLVATGGGADTETDYAYSRRIYLATQSFSNAGSYGAYKFFALSASPAIAQVSVMGPEDGIPPGNVKITVLLQNGEFPNQSILDLVYASCNPDTIRDLCAFLTVQAPIPVPYSVWVDYYVDSSQLNQLSQIQSDVNQAVQDWINANKLNLEGSINPTPLIVAMSNAGASYVLPSNPTHQILTKEQIPSLVNDPVVRYLGDEPDLP